MNTILSDLRHSDTKKQSAAIQDIRSTLQQPTGDDSSSTLEEHKFDFIMEDGIQLLSRAILQPSTSTKDAHQGLTALFDVAEDTFCHWQTIWESLGELKGIARLLEAHKTGICVFRSIMILLNQIAALGLLQAEAKDILRFILVWDLILEHVEDNLDQQDIFLAFCSYLSKQQTTSTPLEMYRRIRSCLSRGAAVHSQDLSCRLVVDELFSHFIHQECEATSIIGSGSSMGRPMRLRSVHFVPCAGAA